MFEHTQRPKKTHTETPRIQTETHQHIEARTEKIRKINQEIERERKKNNIQTKLKNSVLRKKSSLVSDLFLLLFSFFLF